MWEQKLNSLSTQNIYLTSCDIITLAFVFKGIHFRNIIIEYVLWGKDFRVPQKTGNFLSTRINISYSSSAQLCSEVQKFFCGATAQIGPKLPRC